MTENLVYQERFFVSEAHIQGGTITAICDAYCPGVALVKIKHRIDIEGDKELEAIIETLRKQIGLRLPDISVRRWK